MSILLILFELQALQNIGGIDIKTSDYIIYDKNLPESFDGFKILQISDFHNRLIGKDNSRIVKTVRGAKPDMIVFTGDLIDSRHTKPDVTVDFISRICDAAPCYFTTGNHDAYLARCGILDGVLKSLKALGVVILRNDWADIERGGERIRVIGAEDPGFASEAERLLGAGAVIEDELKDIERENIYSVLLSHRPEVFNTYVKMGFNLVFCGHAHGGQFRFPIIGGLFSPGQGLFPKYTSGFFTKEKTTMVVSRGIGNSVMPIRINNPPDVVVATLHKAV